MISDLDVPHRLSFNFTYRLPFGKGARFANSVNGVVNGIIGGWQFGGVYSFQTGFPVAFGTDGFYTGGKISIDNRTTDAWFNTSVFLNQATASHLRVLPFRFSDVRRDNINNFDFSLLKDVRFTESMKIRLTLELYNAFNEPYFPAPQTNPTASNFGTISASNQDNYARRAQLGIKFIF